MLRRDPGLALTALALLLAALLYAPGIGRGLVNYDDLWLIRDHHVHSLGAICCDLSQDTRFALGAEYLPVRDVSILVDGALFGDWWGGFHLTNLLVYLLAIWTWFRALETFGVDRVVAGLAILLWAIHPAHAESVAWLSERKGLLAALFTGVATLGYAHWRRGDRARWLAIAVVAAMLAVWSKAPAVFALAALAGLELALPGRKRGLAGLVAIGAAAFAAFAPVVIVAMRTSVVAGDAGGSPAMALGIHGFYVEDAALLVRAAASYPIATHGPAIADDVAGAVGFAIAIFGLVRGGVWRAAAVLWLANWLPIGRLVLPLRAVLVADRYLLLATLGSSLAIAAGVLRAGRLRWLLVGVLVVASGLRALDAQGNWRDSETLWASAVASNPDDGDAWSAYAEAAADPDAVVAAGLAQTRAPRLVMRAALRAISHGDRASGEQLMREASQGEPRALANLALLRLDAGDLKEALVLGSRAAAAMPMYAPAQRARGKVELAANHPEEALVAFERALALEPNATNHFNLGLALLQLGRREEAVPHFEACLGDPVLGPRAQAALHK